MGDSGDQGQDTNEFRELVTETLITTRDAEARQENQRSNIVGSSNYDAQFTADNLEARGLPPENFMSPDKLCSNSTRQERVAMTQHLHQKIL